MFSFNLKTLIILPHIDDEFALTPLIKKFIKMSSNKLSIVYCAERLNSSKVLINQRRTENSKALKMLGLKNTSAIFLNDYFKVNDKLLHNSSFAIFSFLKDQIVMNNIKQIFTLNFEGGHPDHDSLALIVKKISERFNVKTYFFPAYNSRNTFILPVSVFRPLKSQVSFFKTYQLRNFCWLPSIFLGLIYTSERNAFLKLIPFIFFQAIFSKTIMYTNKINIESVNWNKSLSLKRYNVLKKDILEKIKSIKN